MVGCAMALFYLLLLSLSEHISFLYAYIIATLATVGLIITYVKAVFHNRKITFTMAGLLLALYIFLYVALNLEDYALVVGSIGLFIILAVIMYISRHTNWYALQEGK